MHALTEFASMKSWFAPCLYHSFYFLIIKDTLAVMTDFPNVNSFKVKCKILQKMIQAVEFDLITCYLKENTTHLDIFPATNKDFVIATLIDYISSISPHLNKI